MNKEERNQLIEEYGRGFDLLTAALAGVPREVWKIKPAPHEWSVHETLVHMADSEIMGVVRLHKLIAEPGDTLMVYDSDNWAKGMDYENQDADDALQMFRLMRQRAYRLLKSLPDQVFTHSIVLPIVVHPELGEVYTLEKWLRIYTSHVSEHVEQMKQTYQASKHLHRTQAQRPL